MDKIFSLEMLAGHIREQGPPMWQEVDWQSLMNEVRNAGGGFQLDSLVQQLDTLHTDFGQIPDSEGINAGLYIMRAAIHQKKGENRFAFACIRMAWEALSNLPAGEEPQELYVLMSEFLTKTTMQCPWPWDKPGSGLLQFLKRLQYTASESVRQMRELGLYTVGIDTLLWRKANIDILLGNHSEGNRAKDEHLERAISRRDFNQLGNNLLPDIYSALLHGRDFGYIRDCSSEAGGSFLKAGSANSLVHLLLDNGLAESGLPGDKLESKTKLILTVMLMGKFGLSERTEGAAEALNAARMSFRQGYRFFIWACQEVRYSMGSEAPERKSSSVLRFISDPPDKNTRVARYAWGTARDLLDDATRRASVEESPTNVRAFQGAILRHIWHEMTSLRIDRLSRPVILQSRPLYESQASMLTCRRLTRFTIIHISDLQFKTKDNQFQDVLYWLEQDVNNNYRSMGISRIDCLVLSGDISNKGKKRQYKQALFFLKGFQKVLARFNCDLDFPVGNVILVPGNHDVDWDGSRGTTHTNREGFVVPKKGLEQTYEDRFRDFRSFWKDFYGRDFDESLRYEIFRFSDHAVAIVSLNSCELENHEQHFGYVSPRSMEQANLELQKYPLDFRLAVTHHNLMPLPRSYDKSSIRLDAPDYLRNATELAASMKRGGITIVLHGHVHKEFEPFFASYPGDAAVWIVGVGTVNPRCTRPGPRYSPKPATYNIYELDFSSPMTTMTFHRRVWEADIYEKGGWKTGKLSDGEDKRTISLYTPNEIVDCYR